MVELNSKTPDRSFGIEHIVLNVVKGILQWLRMHLWVDNYVTLEFPINLVFVHSVLHKAPDPVDTPQQSPLDPVVLRFPLQKSKFRLDAIDFFNPQVSPFVSRIALTSKFVGFNIGKLLQGAQVPLFFLHSVLKEGGFFLKLFVCFVPFFLFLDQLYIQLVHLPRGWRGDRFFDTLFLDILHEVDKLGFE